MKNKCKFMCGTEDFPGCDFKFETDKPQPVICPKCGHLYVTWINYER